MLEKFIRIGKNYKIPKDNLAICVEKLFQRIVNSDLHKFKEEKSTQGIK